jgi:hypothetical protein
MEFALAATAWNCGCGEWNLNPHCAIGPLMLTPAHDDRAFPTLAIRGADTRVTTRTTPAGVA